MASEKRGKDQRTVTLDGDKLGHVGGSVIALVVMVLCFVYQETTLETALVRTAWAFVLGYGSIFFLVRVILRITLHEFAETRQRRKEEKREAARERKRAQREARETSPAEAAPEAG
jgi:hypothetical protein